MMIKKGAILMKRHKPEPVEFAKTVAVLLLMVLLVCLCAIYMLSFQGTGQYGFTKDNMQTLSGESVKYQYNDYMESAYVSPKFIGFSAKKLGENIGFYTLGGEYENICTSLLPFYEKLFAEDGMVMSLSAEEGAARFADAMDGNYIYIAYENDLPKSLIYALTAENAMLPAVSGEYLREILILPDRYLYDGISLSPSGTQVFTSVYTFYAIARDSSDNYYLYTTSYVPSGPSDVSFNTNYYLTYTTTKGYFPYIFANELTPDDYFLRFDLSERVTDTTVIPTGFPGKRELSVETVTLKSNEINALLAALLMNPEQVTSFTDADDVRIYYDEGRNVSLSPSGHLEYTAYGEAGLALSDLFEYHAVGETYDLRDYTGAALMLARALENATDAQNEWKLYLSGVHTDGQTVKISFGYAIDGLPIYFEGDKQILTIEFEAGMIKHVAYELRALTCEPYTGDELNPIWTLRIGMLQSEKKREYAYAYSVDLLGIAMPTIIFREK